MAAIQKKTGFIVARAEVSPRHAEDQGSAPLPFRRRRACTENTCPVSDVNPHYLDHVVKLSETSDIEASEDIVSGTGMKLLAKGAKIDARARERLLEFRLNKPLENMMRVVGGTDPALFHPLAEQLLARHGLLRGICATVPGFDPIAVLKALALSDNVRSLLSVYAGQATSKLEHAVGVAVITSALGGSVSANPADASALAIAALTHDVGELYIDPAFLRRGVKLTSRQWKHVATHPIVGSHVLGAMPGAGPRIASVVMAHHERLDGFGYPQGTLGTSLSVAGQMLAVAEMLMGLMESGTHHGRRAAVAMRLVPGEFHRRFIDRVMQGAREDDETDAADPESLDVHSLETRVSGLAATLAHMRDEHHALEPQLARFSAPLRALVAHASTRWDRIGIAFSSTGLDGVADERLHAALSAMSASELDEVGIVLRELEWRIGELERALQIRSELFGPEDARRVNDLIEQARQPMLLAAMTAAAS